MLQFLFDFHDIQQGQGMSYHLFTQFSRILELNTIVNTAIGAGFGAALVFFIQTKQKKAKKQIINFSHLLSIQICLNQMLNLFLQVVQHHDRSRKIFINIYQNDFKVREPEVTWKKFRHIDLPSFNQTIEIEFYSWDYSQFLSKKKREDRQILNLLLPAKFAYQHIRAIIQQRNSLLLDAQNILANRRDNVNRIIYADNRLQEIIGPKLQQQLLAITQEYVNSQESLPIIVFRAFDEITRYIRNNYINFEPHELFIPEELKEAAKQSGIKL